MNIKRKCQIVMLPTQSKAVRLNQLVIGSGNFLFSSRQSNDIGLLTAYELYITSDEEMKKGDYVYVACSEVNVYEIRQITEYYNGQFLFDDESQIDMDYCKKIIATTDTSLKVNRFDKGVFKDLKYSLPQIPQQFIQQYIEEYNKGNVITKIEVEYEDLTEQLQESVDNLRDNCLEDFDNEEESPYYHLLEQAIIELGNYSSKIKVNSDNTINTKPIKNSWSREEVIEVINKFSYENCDDAYRNNDKWIEENL